MDPNIVEHQNQRIIMGWWTMQLGGVYMIPGDALGDFLDAVSPIILELPPDVVVPHLAGLQIAYLVSLLTPEWKDAGNHLIIHEVHPDFIAFMNRLREVEGLIADQVMPALVEEPVQELEKRALTPPSGSEAEE